MNKNKIFNFTLEPDDDFKVLVKNNEVYFDEYETLVDFHFKNLDEIERGYACINEMYRKLIYCAKSESWIDFEYIDPVEFDTGYNFVTKEDKIFLDTPCSMIPIENIEMAKAFVLEFIEAIENMFLSLENGKKYLKKLQDFIMGFHFGYTLRGLRDTYYDKETDCIVEWFQQEDQLLGGLFIENNLISISVDVSYVQLYKDFYRTLNELDNKTFIEYTYIDPNKNIDVFKIVEVEKNVFNIIKDDTTIVLNKKDLKYLFKKFVKDFERMCLKKDHGEWGKALLERVKNPTKSIKNYYEIFITNDMKSIKFTWKNCDKIESGFDVHWITVEFNEYKLHPIISFSTGEEWGVTFIDKTYNSLGVDDIFDIFHQLSRTHIPEKTYDEYTCEVKADGKLFKGYLDDILWFELIKQTIYFNDIFDYVNSKIKQYLKKLYGGKDDQYRIYKRN